MGSKGTRDSGRKGRSGAKIRSGVAAEVELGRLGVEKIGAVRLGLRELMLRAGASALQSLMIREIEELCGPRYARKSGEASASRWGSQDTDVVLGGQKIKVSRPRARRDGAEVPLASLESVQVEDPFNERVVEQMTVGVSTRKYKRSVEFGDVGSGTSKSEVSRRFVAMTQARMEKALGAPVGAVEWAALMVDGIEFADHVVIIALGIDGTGAKHVLGLREGSTENASVCHSLLADVVARGFPADRNLLVVIDGGKGLRKAVRKVFGSFGCIQRCTVHKKRNILDHVPEERRPGVLASLNEAYSARNPETGKKLLNNLARTLDKTHPGAAASLREGLDETLTVQRLGIPPALARSLSTTNAIENLNGTIRHVSKRVKRWRDGTMVLRWAATGVFEAARGFRRIKGYKQMPILVESLRQLDASPEAEAMAKVA